jgi:type IV secretory pathway VirD2 relaxase
MVKVTGGGRGMKAIAAHLRYISKNGRLEIEDDEGRLVRGKEALREIADWRYGGALIRETSHRREAFNIMLSMPRGSAQASIVQRAAREFAGTELAGHKYVMVLHDHQANPHVHFSVRAGAKDGRRLNPRKADLQRWRETFAEKLRELGIDAEATRQPTRGASRTYPSLWEEKARAEGRLRRKGRGQKGGAPPARSRTAAADAWHAIAQTLHKSPDKADRELAAPCAELSSGCRAAADAMRAPGLERSASQDLGSARGPVDPLNLTR